MRSVGDSDMQKGFWEALIKLRNGCSTEKDWKLFLSRKPHQYNKSFSDITKLVFSNESASEHDSNMLDSLNVPSAEIVSNNTPKTASKLSSEEFGGLENRIFFS